MSLCNPMDCSPPGSSIHGILQARILEWVALPSSRESSRPRDQTQVSYTPELSGRFLTTSASWQADMHNWRSVDRLSMQVSMPDSKALPSCSRPRSTPGWWWWGWWPCWHVIPYGSSTALNNYQYKNTNIIKIHMEMHSDLLTALGLPPFAKNNLSSKRNQFIWSTE